MATYHLMMASRKQKGREKIMTANFDRDFITAYIALYQDATEKEAMYIYSISSYEYIKMIINQYEEKHLPKFNWK